MKSGRNILPPALIWTSHNHGGQLLVFNDVHGIAIKMKHSLVDE